jgi:hypothetical protein
MVKWGDTNFIATNKVIEKLADFTITNQTILSILQHQFI